MENPPKMETTDSGLFLLEVLIDNVSFVKSSRFSDKDFRTCVTIEATAVKPLEICDDDPGACVASGGHFVKTFNSGKLCLFSLPEAEITKAMSSFPIRVTVHKCLPCGCVPTKIVMGIATIDMTEKFVQSRKKYMYDPTSVNFQALKDSFQLFADDGGERVGDILMILRISCFGKLIITRFQGEGLTNLRTSQEASIVDGSCKPHRQFQTSQDACVCCAAKVAGAGRGTPGTCPPCQHGGGHGGGPCPMTQDSYNSTPCQDPGDICYCSGPNPPSKHPMVCKDMDHYCLHVPKGILPSLPIYQDLTEEQILEIKSTNQELKLLHVEDHFNSSSIAGSSILCSETATIVDEYSKSLTDTGFSSESIQVKLDHSASLCTIWSKRRSVSFSDKVDYASKSYNHPNYRKNYSNKMPKSIFGEKITTVYVTLFEDLCRRHTSGTQATASVNKCLQASQSKDCVNSNINNHFVCSNSTVNTSGSAEPSVQDHIIRYSDIYFFGKNKSDKKLKKGMGSTKPAKKDTVSQASSHTSASAQPQLPNKVQSSAASVQAQPPYKSESIQYSYYATTRAKTVSIRDRPCPGVVGVTKGDVVATLSHIIIGPREQCPVHGREPCQGPKCVIAASGLNANDQAAVKVTTVTNPRRGVFELVIRKLTGAPLARNELMLEWTPPPCRPPACGSQCPTPCVLTPSCRPSKCKMIVCRPTPCRPAKCCTKPCRSPCMRCSRTSCGKPCSSCKPCRPCVPASYLCRPCPPSPRCRPCPPWPRCRPCPPRPPSSLCTPCPPSPRCRPCPPLPRCRPCPPPPRRRRCRPLRGCKPCPPTPRCRPCPPKPCEAPCTQACGSRCCDLPCKSSPCLRPCPVGYRKPHKIRCQPKIRAHRKLISPCSNRSKACPMVRCRSVPGPCVGCCGAPPCIPRKCCSIFPWRPRKCPVYACSIRKCGLSPCPPVPCPPQKCCLASRYKIKNCCGQGC